jgi:hypothetical protein
MLQWLLDGSGLIVGAALLDLSTGAWRPVPPGVAAAPGVEGTVALLQLDAEGGPLLWAEGRGPASPAARLMDRSPEGWRWVHGIEGGQLWAQATDRDTGDVACFFITAGAVEQAERCIEGGFVELDAVLPAGPGRWVIDSHGEGHPDVALVEWTGEAYRPIATPWEDLYPFGPLQMLPRVDGSFDVLTRCRLDRPRPCLRADGEGSEDQVDRWYRWRPGEAPRLLARGRRATGAPDPSSARVARLHGGALCIDGPRERQRCFAVPPFAGL